MWGYNLLFLLKISVDLLNLSMYNFVNNLIIFNLKYIGGLIYAGNRL